MENNENQDKPKGKLPLPKNPKFNYYWIYGLLALLLIGFQVFQFRSSNSDVTNEQDFFKMVKDGDVEKIIIVNNEQVEVFIYQDTLQTSETDKKHTTNEEKLERYKNVSKSPLGGENTGEQFKGYTTLDFSSSYDTAYGRWTLGIENLADKQYFTYYAQSTPAAARYFAGIGRTLNLSWSHAF